MVAMSAKVWDRGERGYWVRIYAQGTSTAKGPFGHGDEGKRLAREFSDSVNAAQSAVGRWGQWRPGLPIPVDELVKDWQRIHGPLRSERTQCTDHARVERLAEWFGAMDARSLHEGVCREFSARGGLPGVRSRYDGRSQRSGSGRLPFHTSSGTQSSGQWGYALDSSSPYPL